MRLEFAPLKDTDDAFEVLQGRYDAVLKLGTPLWIYHAPEVMREPSFQLILSYDVSKLGFACKPFFRVHRVERNKWWFGFENNGPTYSFPEPRSMDSYGHWLDYKGCFSNEMPVEFRSLARSIVRAVFESDWSGSKKGFSVYE